MPIATTNPTTGEVVRTFEELSEQELDARLERASVAFRSYRRTSYEQRAGWLRAAADLLDAEAQATAELMTLEMGKTVAAARAEVAKCAVGFRYYADHGPAFLADEEVDAAAVRAGRAYVRWQPLGPVLAIMPWNFPLWQAVRFAAPALLAGNVGLLKHASNVPQTALYLEDVLARAGFPADVFSTLLIGSEQVERVLRDDRVVAATLTGSTPAGRSVAGIAGDELKPTVLELGGSDPFVVMPSADLERAATVAATARCQNNGQSCIAAKRFIVHQDVADEFERLFADALRRWCRRPDRTSAPDVGPLPTPQGREECAELVDEAVGKGATVVLGGAAPGRAGLVLPPDPATGVTTDMRVYAEEVFGPVAVLHRAKDLDEALRSRTTRRFGLGSNAWTNDPAGAGALRRRARRGHGLHQRHDGLVQRAAVRRVEDQRLRPRAADLGIREFCNAKTVWVGGSDSGDTSTSRAE
jgi:succinate-semialdehyde dehydrogenase/glutarate-semialdehyde dehydrogenase